MAGKTKTKNNATSATDATEATTSTPSPGDDLAGLAAREAMAHVAPTPPTPPTPATSAPSLADLKAAPAYMATRPIFAEGWPPVEEGEVLFDPDPAFLAVAAPGALVPAQLAD